MSKFPSKAELKVIRRQMARVQGSRGLSPNANALDRAKYEVCEQLLIFMKKKNWSQRELAHALETSDTRVSEMLHYRIEKFTLDRLVTYLQMVKPKITLHVA